MIGTIITMLLILSVLIFIHELGHFLAAKKFGIRVDEFAIGFPPKIWSFFKNGTRFAINLIPLGGYVKIHGEAIEDKEQLQNFQQEPDSFVSKTKWQQIVVLLGGITFNILLAFFLFTISGLIPGKTIINDPVPLDAVYEVIGLRPDSPAEMAGIQIGTEVKKITAINQESNELITQFENPRTSDVRNFLDSFPNPEVIKFEFNTIENGVENVVTLNPVFDETANNFYVGVGIEPMEMSRLNLIEAVSNGFGATLYYTGAIFTGLISFVAGFFNGGDSAISMLSGPVGLTGYVGEASQIGFAYLLEFIALISLNLAVLNLFPIPALDGGRVLFVIIEAITKKPIPPKTANIVNSIGFGLLLLLMIVVSIYDIIKVV